MCDRKIGRYARTWGSGIGEPSARQGVVNRDKAWESRLTPCPKLPTTSPALLERSKPLGKNILVGFKY